MPLKHVGYYVYIMVIISFIQGCATFSQSEAPDTIFTTKKTLHNAWINHKKKISLVHNWSIKARSGVITKKRSGSASLVWKQDKDNYDFIVSGPLGNNFFQLTGNLAKSTLFLPKKNPITTDNPQRLLSKYIGFNIPFYSLFFWVKGIPSPLSTSEINLNDNGRLQTLYQNDWFIKYNNYVLVSSIVLPGNIEISNNETKIKLAILWDKIY